MDTLYQLIGIAWIGFLLVIIYIIGRGFIGKLKTFDWSSIYILGAGITGTISFVLIWVYALSQWGLLLGLVFGWIPAIIGAFIAGLLWPLIVGVLLYMILQS